MKIEKINKLLEDEGEPPIKIRRPSKLSAEEKSNLKKSLNNLANIQQPSFKSSNLEEDWVEEFKQSMSKQTKRSEKLNLLTTLPSNWTNRKIQQVFNVSRRMTRQARKLRKNGFGTRPEPKKGGRRLSNETINLVKNFYLSDDVSRMMPGVKDCISVVENGVRQMKQKRLLLNNLDNLYNQCKVSYPNVTISWSKFTKLRPKECILAGKNGTHNVCVCKVHENVKLKLFGIKQNLKEKGVAFDTSYRDYINTAICENPKAECYFSKCEECPGTESISTDLKSIFQDNNITEINFTQWIKTDRYFNDKCNFYNFKSSIFSFTKRR